MNSDEICFIKILAVLFLVTVLFGCGTSRKITSQVQVIPAPEKPDISFYKIYSEKLNIPLNGTENKDLLTAIGKWYGTQYKWGGCSEKGIDCSCFVQSVYREAFNYELDRTSLNMYYNNLKPITVHDLQEGDILCFKINSNEISHVGIYLKDFKFVHSTSSRGVIISDLRENYYKKRFFTAARVIGFSNNDSAQIKEKTHRTLENRSFIRLGSLLIAE